MKKQQRTERITLYISKEKRDRAKALKEAFKVENTFFPWVSQNAWLNQVLDAGLNALALECRQIQEEP